MRLLYNKHLNAFQFTLTTLIVTCFQQQDVIHIFLYTENIFFHGQDYSIFSTNETQLISDNYIMWNHGIHKYVFIHV